MKNKTQEAIDSVDWSLHLNWAIALVVVLNIGLCDSTGRGLLPLGIVGLSHVVMYILYLGKPVKNNQIFVTEFMIMGLGLLGAIIPTEVLIEYSEYEQAGYIKLAAFSVFLSFIHIATPKCTRWRVCKFFMLLAYLGVSIGIFTVGRDDHYTVVRKTNDELLLLEQKVAGAGVLKYRVITMQPRSLVIRAHFTQERVGYWVHANMDLSFTTPKSIGQLMQLESHLSKKGEENLRTPCQRYGDELLKRFVEKKEFGPLLGHWEYEVSLPNEPDGDLSKLFLSFSKRTANLIVHTSVHKHSNATIRKAKLSWEELRK